MPSRRYLLPNVSSRWQYYCSVTTTLKQFSRLSQIAFLKRFTTLPLLFELELGDVSHSYLIYLPMREWNQNVLVVYLSTEDTIGVLKDHNGV